MTNTTSNPTRIDADESRTKASWSEKFPLIIAGLHAAPDSVEPEPEDQQLKAAARIALRLGGED